MVAYLILIARLREELENLKRVIPITQQAIERTQQQPDDIELYINSAALSLHSFYVGLERMFLTIAEEVDQKVPSGSSWHLDLVNQMAYDLPTTRPPVLTKQSRHFVHEYRSFRHVVRNVYTYHLNATRVSELVEMLPEAFEAIEQDLRLFFEFLDNAGRTVIDQ